MSPATTRPPARPAHHPSVSRRRILAGAAWAAPAIVVGVTAPTAAASTIDPAPPATPEWIFAGDSSQWNQNGYYDIKSQLWRNSQAPDYQQKMNTPHDGAANFAFYVDIDLSGRSGGAPFFAIDPESPAGPDGIHFDQSDGWSVSVLGHDADAQVLSIVLVNSAMGGFNPGTAIQNVFLVIPTTAKDPNGRYLDGSQYLTITYTADTFVTRGPEGLA